MAEPGTELKGPPIQSVAHTHANACRGTAFTQGTDCVGSQELLALSSALGQVLDQSAADQRLSSTACLFPLKPPHEMSEINQPQHKNNHQGLQQSGKHARVAVHPLLCCQMTQPPLAWMPNGLLSLRWGL